MARSRTSGKHDEPAEKEEEEANGLRTSGREALAPVDTSSQQKNLRSSCVVFSQTEKGEDHHHQHQPPFSPPFFAANNSLTITPQWHIIQSSAGIALLSDGCVMDSSQRGEQNAKNTRTHYTLS
uniref:HDC13506 n=1 Tax=Drosophila melanogaster TaxID=7227 RepID=Q6IK22_DROME|nr:TPA_inf: HDC13506 [Drosophila melanogaster]